jgi:hypothetical protein
MSTKIVSDLSDKWSKLKSEETAGRPIPLAKLEILLRECVDSGASLSLPRDRAIVQQYATEVTDAIFVQTKQYRPSLLLPLIAARRTRLRRWLQWIGGYRSAAAMATRNLLLCVTCVLLCYALWKYANDTVVKDPVTIKETVTVIVADMKAAERATVVGNDFRQSLWSIFGTLPPETQETLAVQNCLKFIRGCQVKDGCYAGSLRMSAADQGVWIWSSKASLAGLALLASSRAVKNNADNTDQTQVVRKWLEWHATHQNPLGQIPRFKGRLDDRTPIEELDSGSVVYDTDAPANFLLLLDRYTADNANPALANYVHQAADAAFAQVLIRTSPVKDSPDTLPYPYYFLAGLTDYGGATAAGRYFTRRGDVNRAKLASDCANRIAARLRGFQRTFSGSRPIYALYTKDGRYYLGNGQSTGQPPALIPVDVTTSLAGSTWVEADPEGWKAFLQERTDPGDEADLNAQDPEAPVEAWFAAAKGLKSEDEPKWRQRTLQAAVGFRYTTAYVHRPAIVMLTIWEGTAWRPDVAAVKVP